MMLLALAADLGQVTGSNTFRFVLTRGWVGGRGQDHAFCRGNWRPLQMAKRKGKRDPKRVPRLPDLEQSKSAVLDTLTVRPHV